MKKPVIFFLLTTLLISSCAAEKYTSSPFSSSSYSAQTHGPSLEDRLGGTMKQNINAAEITNLIATFPRFSTDAVDKEVLLLKEQLQNYLYAYEAYNLEGKKRALKEIEKRYRKIQQLRKFLSPDDDEVINRYLVRIKTNISTLESPALLQP
ncbi:MAG: hypothetical protein K0M63_01145 [Weeksellaceae bacterium]|nr:hypothetical protein [Weeksellaceae bacterium]